MKATDGTVLEMHKEARVNIFTIAHLLADWGNLKQVSKYDTVSSDSTTML